MYKKRVRIFKIMDLYEVLLNIKNKKELRNLSEDFLYNLLIRELKSRKNIFEKIEKAKNFKELKRDEEFLYFFKEIRKKIHETFGVFAPKDLRRIYKILYEDLSLEEKIIEILMLSLSTKERLNFYKEIYKKIFLEDPVEIMDLASGLNPISIFFSDKKPKRYFFVDISEDIIDINYTILKQLNIEPIGYCSDISNFNKDFLKRKYQYIFLWKTIPILEKIDKKLPINLLSILDFDYIVISFPQKSLGKIKKLGLAWRYWIKKVAKKLNYKIIEEFDIPYEFFIILSK